MTAPAVMASHTEVALAWVKSVVGSNVATSLPKPESWSTSGFVTVMIVGGASNADIPMRRPVVSVDVWANSPQSNTPPWGKANSLAEAIYAATYAATSDTLTVAGQDVRVFSVYPVSEPIRVPDDQAGYAHVMFNLELSWVVL